MRVVSIMVMHADDVSEGDALLVTPYVPVPVGQWCQRAPPARRDPQRRGVRPHARGADLLDNLIGIHCIFLYNKIDLTGGYKGARGESLRMASRRGGEFWKTTEEDEDIMTERLHKARRPRGAPSQVLPGRVPVALIERLDRSLDLAETRTGLRGNRTEAIRQALASWLDAKEEALGVSWPPSLLAPPNGEELPRREVRGDCRR